MRHSQISIDPVATAQGAGLRYASDDKPGIQRRKSGSGFRYIDIDGKPVRDKAVVARIKSLVIPPAWKDVWICPSPNGHLQATGRDARGRKQSRYHPQWREVRDETKYERMMIFGKALPAIRKRVAEDISLPGLPREKVLATIVRLLETTFIRVGNFEYARENHSCNTPSVCRKCYVHPVVLDWYMSGAMRDIVGKRVDDESSRPILFFERMNWQ